MQSCSKQKTSTFIGRIITISCISAIISFTLTGCNGGSSYDTASSSAAQIMGIPGKPRVSSINPANNAINVFPDTSITVTYNYPVKSVNTTTFTVAEESAGPNIDGKITAKGDNLTFTFTPTNLLSYNAKYKVNLKGVKNYEDIEGGNAEDFSSSFSIVNNGYLIFVESNAGNGFTGNLITAIDPNATAESISNIDSICNNSRSKPVDPSGMNRTYKAVIGSDYRYPSSSTRISKDWALQPNTEYYRADNKQIGRTGINQTFTFPLGNTLYTADARVWTGLNAHWSIGNNSCKQWTNKNSSQNGHVGRADALNENAIDKEDKHCNGHGYIYCAMQPTTTMLSPTPGGTILADALLPILIQFNNASGVDPSSVSTSSFFVTAESSSIPITGIIISTSESTYQFLPNEKFTSHTKYIVTVTGVKDKNNYLIPDAKFMFTAVAALNIMFVTHKNWDGKEINGIHGADNKCQDEANEMGLDGQYRAMIFDDSNDVNHNWSLKPNTEYFNFNADSVGTTNESAIFDQNLSHHIYDGNRFTYKRVWTGIQIPAAGVWRLASNGFCSGWNPSGLQNSDEGVYGSSNSLEIIQVIHAGKELCGRQADFGSSPGREAHLYCVKQ